MAQIEVKVPVLSESVAEATLLAWHKKVGEPVARDENLIDIETDKVVLELPAPAAGVIVQIIKADGSTVMAGEVIAIIDTEGSAKVSPLEVSAAPVQTEAPAAPAAAPMPASRVVLGSYPDEAQAVSRAVAMRAMREVCRRKVMEAPWQVLVRRTRQPSILP